MPDSLLVTPDEVEDLIVDVIRRRHVEHLAKLERQRGKGRETYERFRTVSHMASETANVRISGDTLPACLLGVLGTAAPPRRDEQDRLIVPLQLGMQVSVLGQRRRDTLRRRDVMAWTTIECVLQRVPRNGPVKAVELTDYEPVQSSDEQRILAEARVIFTVSVDQMVAVVGGLPADDTEWPAGGPNGPPAGPYQPPAGAPVATEISATWDRESLVE